MSNPIIRFNQNTTTYDFSLTSDNKSSQFLSSSPKTDKFVPPLGEYSLTYERQLLQDIQNSFKRVKNLKSLKKDKDQIYTLPASGSLLTGTSDEFLRRRNAKEILASGYSTGCGDYAIAFYSIMQKMGYEVLFIDSAALSPEGYISNASGHTGVAVYNKKEDKWCLVDPTNQVILDENWDPSTKIYQNKYWIGYCGPLENYPVHSYSELRNFYKQTYESMPPQILQNFLDEENLRSSLLEEVLKGNLVPLDFNFEIDPSFFDENNTPHNPNYLKFQNLSLRSLESYSEGVTTLKYNVLIIPGEYDVFTDFKYDRHKNQTTMIVGSKSAMTESLLLKLQEDSLKHQSLVLPATQEIHEF